MINKLKIIFSLFAISILNLAFGASFRTSFETDKINSSMQYIAVDFQVPIGEHITAPIGKGKAIAPNIKLTNAKVIDTFWPQSEKLKNSDGSDSDYYGYSKNFTILYKIEIDDVSKPIKYDLFYVSCGNACMPKQQQGTIAPNAMLDSNEIERLTGTNTEPPTNIMLAIILGILGGMILNFMPCVFPIVSMKLFSIAKSAKENTSTIKKQTISFAAGNIFCFSLIGTILLILRKTMPDLGWGFYMQEPKFVVALLILFLLCGLNFFGLYNFKLPTKRVNLPIKKAYISSFFNGIFSAIASTSCVGPFVGVAIASAVLYLDFAAAIVVFVSIGFGTAFPFLLLSIFPTAIKILPAPGKWLEMFKEFMGFAMLLSCVWFLWILTSQIEINNIMLIIANLIILSLFVWIFGKSSKVKIVKIFALFGILISCALSIYSTNISNQTAEKIEWKEYSEQTFEDTLNSGKPIFLNFTASWCVNCKFNDSIFKSEEIINLFKKNEIQAIKCDWTHRNQKVSNLLKSYGAAAVPFYVYYPAGNKDYIILPSIITKNKLLKIIGDKYEDS